MVPIFVAPKHTDWEDLHLNDCVSGSEPCECGSDRVIRLVTGTYCRRCGVPR